MYMQGLPPYEKTPSATLAVFFYRSEKDMCRSVYLQNGSLHPDKMTTIRRALQ
jgi:hypothetical protein